MFLRDKEVTVTSARLVVGASTYALRDFTSVRRTEHRERSTQPFGSRRLASAAAGGALLACVSLAVAGLMPSGGPWGVLCLLPALAGIPIAVTLQSPRRR